MTIQNVPKPKWVGLLWYDNDDNIIDVTCNFKERFLSPDENGKYRPLFNSYEIDVIISEMYPTMLKFSQGHAKVLDGIMKAVELRRLAGNHFTTPFDSAYFAERLMGYFLFYNVFDRHTESVWNEQEEYTTEDIHINALTMFKHLWNGCRNFGMSHRKDSNFPDMETKMAICDIARIDPPLHKELCAHLFKESL